MIADGLSKWVVGVAGSAIFIGLVWLASIFLNWRVNHKVYKELRAIRILLERRK